MASKLLMPNDSFAPTADMVLSAYHSQLLPPTGIAHAVSLNLLPTANNERPSAFPSHRGQLLSHIVTARDDVVDVYEVRRSAHPNDVSRTEESVYHLASHQVFGSVTGIGKCRVDDADSPSHSGPSSSTTPRDTLVLSFADAKMALMQWSESEEDLVTISIHTYERAEQLAEGVPSHFLPLLRVDTDSRCAVLLLPKDTFAILPFYHDTAEELDQLLEQAGSTQQGLSLERSLPYAPSFLLTLQTIDPDIRNVRDFVFLPDFQRPTVAVLYETNETWTGRLDERHDTCAVRIITLDLTISSIAAHRIISSKNGLPYDCLYLSACPQSFGGGVLIATSSALIHLDQNERIIGLAASEWHGLTSRLSLPMWNSSLSETNNGAASKDDASQLDLTDSQIAFPVGLSSAFLFLQDGTVWMLAANLEGRSIASLSLQKKGTSAPSSVALMLTQGNLLLAGSMVGPSDIFRLKTVSRDVQEHVKDDGSDIDMELDAELYGDSTASGSLLTGSRGRRQIADVEVELATTIPALGPISAISPAIAMDHDNVNGLSQTVVCSGAGPHGGLNILEPKIVPRNKQQLALNATHGIWYISANTVKRQKLVLTSSRETSEVTTLEENGLIVASIPLKGRTLYSRMIDQLASVMLRVKLKGVEILDTEGKIIKILELGDDRPSEVEIFKAEYALGFVALLWTDGSIELLKCDASNIELVEIPHELQSRRFIAAGILVDDYHTLQYLKQETLTTQSRRSTDTAKVSAATNTDEDEIDYGEDDYNLSDASVRNGTDTLSTGGINGKETAANVWLTLTTDEACVQIYSLKDFYCAWQSNSLYPAPMRLDFVSNASEDTDVDSLELAQVQICYLGDTLHLTAAFENGLINVYKAVHHVGEDDDTKKAVAEAQRNILTLSFVKIIAQELDIGESSVMNVPTRDSVSGLTLTPFNYLDGHNGLFIGGASPAWLLRNPQGLTHLYMSAESPMEFFDVVPQLDQQDFVYAQYGLACLARLPPHDYTYAVPHQKKARTGRTYAKAAPHPATQTLLASSISKHQFVLFDPEDGHVVEDPDIDPTYAYSYRSSLELFADGEEEPVDGYEFQQCEVVNCIQLVTLQSRTTASGLRDYIAVGTIISHGEDRPARGATYIFDVVEVVPVPGDPASRYKLRMLVKDDAKGPISSVTDMNGYLVVVMGLKVSTTCFFTN